jgi:hypothetical protein
MMVEILKMLNVIFFSLSYHMFSCATNGGHKARRLFAVALNALVV